MWDGWGLNRLLPLYVLSYVTFVYVSWWCKAFEMGRSNISSKSKVMLLWLKEFKVNLFYIFIYAFYFIKCHFAAVFTQKRKKKKVSVLIHIWEWLHQIGALVLHHKIDTNMTCILIYDHLSVSTPLLSFYHYLRHPGFVSWLVCAGRFWLVWFVVV